MPSGTIWLSFELSLKRILTCLFVLQAWKLCPQGNPTSKLIQYLARQTSNIQRFYDLLGMCFAHCKKKIKTSLLFNEFVCLTKYIKYTTFIDNWSISKVWFESKSTYWNENKNIPYKSTNLIISSLLVASRTICIGQCQVIAFLEFKWMILPCFSVKYLT